jgi:hypothetical protein
MGASWPLFDLLQLEQILVGIGESENLFGDDVLEEVPYDVSADRQRRGLEGVVSRCHFRRASRLQDGGQHATGKLPRLGAVPQGA